LAHHGIGKAEQGDPHGTIADFTAAIEREPTAGR
jgi:hypothetical protein